MSDSKKVVTIYCDGACKGNPGPGGWGAILLYNEHKKMISGFEEHTTNNQMELKAAIEALSAIKDRKVVEVKIYTDSSYVKNGITLWIKKWKENGWKRGKEKVKNSDLWKELDSLNCDMEIEWYWVKGHSGDKYNEIADKLATDEIKKNLKK